MTENLTPGQTVALKYVTERILHPTPPFHFDGTVYKASYFPGLDLVYEKGHLWQSMRFNGQSFGVRLDNLGTCENPEVRLVLYSQSPVLETLTNCLAEEIAYRYDFTADLRVFYDGFGADELLAPVLERWRGTRPSSYTSLYEYLVIATLLQNATVRRTVQMSENLFQRFGQRLAFDGKTLGAFWDPYDIQAASDDELRSLKVGYRSKTLKRQAESFGVNGLDEIFLRSLPNPELKKQLLSIYGIGAASVWYLLFGQFKRYDVFEYVSPWEQKIFSRLLFGQELVGAGQILTEADQRWGRWKMLAAHLLFEDLFWQHRRDPIPWLAALIRL